MVYAEPKARLRDFEVTASLDKQRYADGQFALDARFAGQPGKGEIVATIYDGKTAVLNTSAAGRRASVIDRPALHGRYGLHFG